METDNKSYSNRNRPLGGLILVVIGALLLAHKVIPEAVPGWLFTWPMILVAAGLYAGARRSFRMGGWLVPVALGAFFLVDQMVFDIDIRPYFWPILIIGIGLLMIFRPHRRKWNANMDNVTTGGAADLSSSDSVDLQTYFGGVKKNIITKDFKGGRIENFFGGTELNLVQADFTGTAVLDFNVAFGGVKLVLPPQWTIQSEVSAVLGGIEEKRDLGIPSDATKTLILRGSVIFGGLEIKSR